MPDSCRSTIVLCSMPHSTKCGWGTEQGTGGVLGRAGKHEEVLSDHLQTSKSFWVSMVQHAKHFGHSDLP